MKRMDVYGGRQGLAAGLCRVCFQGNDSRCHLGPPAEPLTGRKQLVMYHPVVKGWHYSGLESNQSDNVKNLHVACVTRLGPASAASMSFPLAADGVFTTPAHPARCGRLTEPRLRLIGAIGQDRYERAEGTSTIRTIALATATAGISAP